MAYVSIKVLSETLNIDTIIEDARQEWQKRENKRRSLEKWLVRLIPIGLIIMAVVFYLLSAPHTAGIVNIITPEYGKLAPIAWELGIVIVSALIEAGWRKTMVFALLWTLVLMSVFINIAGAFIAVIESGSSAALSSDTFLQLLERYGGLPATYQVVLFLVVPIGAVIPLMAKAVGEILIKLAMGRVKLETESDEMRWIKERTRVVYGALFNAALKAGAGTATAGNWANAVTKQIFRETVVPQHDLPEQASTRSIEAPQVGFGAIAHRQGLDSPGQSGALIQSSQNPVVLDTANSKDNNGLSSVRLSRKDLVTWMEQHPEHQSKHPRALSKLYMLEKHGVESDSGYKSFERVKKEMGL